MSNMQILDMYMVIGGVPYYWEFLKKGLSVAQNIDQMFFAPEAQLRQEYDYLFSSLFHNPENYIQIIQALAGKKMGITRAEIAEKAKQSPSGNLTRKLMELENCGFIREYLNYGKKKKEALYQLIDPFTLFHQHFLTKKSRDAAFWSHHLNTPVLNSWSGLAFEQVCLLHAEQIKKALGISSIHTDIFSFHCKSNSDEGLFGSQIDMVIWRADHIINIIEMKYSTGLYLINKAQFNSIQKKAHDFITETKSKDAVHLTMVTTNGVEPNAYSADIQYQITLEDLFQT